MNAQLTTLFEIDTRRAVNDIRVKRKYAARLRLLARRRHATARKQAVVRKRHRFVVGAFNVEHPAQHKTKRMLKRAIPVVAARRCRREQPFHHIGARRRCDVLARPRNRRIVDERIFERRDEFLDFRVGRFVEEEMPQKHVPRVLFRESLARHPREHLAPHNDERIFEIFLIRLKTAFFFGRILGQLLVFPQRLRVSVSVLPR